MNFDLDDPLDGLLSDGSNDSLFGNEGTKKPAKPSKSSKMEDLFGIKSTEAPKSVIKPEQTAASGPPDRTQPASLDYSKPSTSATVQQPTSLTSVQGKKSGTPAKMTNAPALKPQTPQKKEISFDDSDLLSDLGFDPKKPRSKSSILDDILGGPLVASTKEVPAKSVVAKPRASLTITKEEGPPTTTTTGNLSRQSTETSENVQTEGTVLGGYAPSGGGSTLPPRRSGRRQSSISALNDPLGLFGTPAEDKPVRRESRPSVKKGGADWLGLNEESNSNEVDPVPGIPVPITKPQPQVTTTNTTTPIPAVKVAESVAPIKQEMQPKTEEDKTIRPLIVPDTQVLASTLQFVNAETENALLAMEQQDFQLSVVNQMKNQEKALYDMQQKQRSVLQKQEAQFNELLQKQLQRHTVLEELLSKQQERINANIQLIMNQPPSASLQSRLDSGAPFSSSATATHEAQLDDPLTKVELQTEVKRLEMEKLRLEDLVANLTTNHEQELSLLEASYKKQAGFLEESLKIMETRLKNENKQLEEFYQSKVHSLELEKSKLIEDHLQLVKEMEENHRKVIEKLKQGYEESLEQLRQDHREMITTIRESKLLEFSVVQENQSYLQMLKNASSYLENASGDLQQLRDTLQDQIEFSQKEKDLQLKAREKQLEDQQKLLERTRESANEEKGRLLSLVELLESKVTEMTKVSSQERWEYQQKCAKLEAERQGFEKEKHFLRERNQQEEDRIAELKLLQMEEHKRLQEKLVQERQALLEEKVKLETMAQLQSSSSQLKGATSQAEIDAAIKVTEEATRQADKEKDRYLQLQRQFETKRRELLSREGYLRERSDELETAMERARQRERNAENVYRSVRKAEQNLQLTMQLVQRQFREVSEREDRLAKEKIELSKERLELQAVRRKLQQTRCSLCRIGEKSQEIGDLLTTNTDSVADDLKLEANFTEMQHRLDSTGMKLDHYLDSDVDRQMKLFLQRNRVDQFGELADLDGILLDEQQERQRAVGEDPVMFKIDALLSPAKFEPDQSHDQK
ncbi:fas-binding factor 1 homolog [Anopheles albimanus]|uniref:Fas-binding factor 1 C-terminal domain-containing protein n=1 Tax=Anopheles albimanus TaxID=7167 RepID=A0A182FM50_ANOAL|nr:fas-binding factor 1 homolog [Anopheles albimanus]